MEPVLWHITISHFNEKVRWALDFKEISYRTRAPLPGMHMAVALWLTRGRQYTFPVIDFGDERVGGSTAIIDALDRRHPARPLVPDPGGDRDRALALSHWFDDELGPYVRQYVFHELLLDPECFAEVFSQAAPGPFQKIGPGGEKALRAIVGGRYGAISGEGAAEARQRVLAGFDRLESELDDGDYLVADQFGVADISAASLLYPVVGPPESFTTFDRMPEPVEHFREELSGRRGFKWVEEMFRRHRHPSSARQNEEG